MKISVIGTGYVGLVSGLCLAEKGHKVICVDVDPKKIEKLRNAVPTIHESGLEELLKKNVGTSFTATTDLSRAVMETDISIIAVGTPFNGESIDLSSIKQAARDIGKELKGKKDYHIVVVKSTVVPGTTDDVVLPILEEASGKKAGLDFGVGMNPEFLSEGKAVKDFMNPDRIVLGGIDEKTLEKMSALYSIFDGVEVVKTNNKTAEMTKYAANSLLATLISFSNEIGNLCSELGNVDVTEVMKGVHKDKRFSPITSNGERISPGFLSYLAAGCGFGGSCFPKDVKALVAYGKAAGNSMRLLDAVIEINKNQPKKVISLLRKHISDLEGIRVSVLGLAFKPGTDDMRESPAIPIVKDLLKNKAQVQVYDPVANGEAKKLFGNKEIKYCDNLEDSISEAEAVILITQWNEFNRIPELVKNISPQPLLIDGRRMLSKDQFEKYEGIGLS